jgi:hypothetical protein
MALRYHPYDGQQNPSELELELVTLAMNSKIISNSDLKAHWLKDFTHPIFQSFKGSLKYHMIL